MTAEAQAIFDAVRKTLPVKWEGKSIVVNEQTIVEAPYTVANCRKVSERTNGQAFDYCKKVVSAVGTRPA